MNKNDFHNKYNRLFSEADLKEIDDLAATADVPEAVYAMIAKLNERWRKKVARLDRHYDALLDDVDDEAYWEGRSDGFWRGYDVGYGEGMWGI